MSLLTSTSLPPQIIARSSLALIFLTVVIVSLAAPLARVAETFEYEVYRALNNPVVMRESQRHFGQQFLTHLRTLDWGFRFGGTVISVKIVMHITVAMVVTVFTTVGQAMLDKVSLV